MNLKSLLLSALDTVRDDSDKSSPVRIVLEPKSSRQDPQEFMNLLLANTRLEASLPVNLVMLGPRRPSALEEPEADRRGMDGVPIRDGDAPHASIAWARSTGASTSSKAGSSRCFRSTR